MHSINEDRKTPKTAVLVTGTYREVEFLLQLFPFMAGNTDYDIFLVLRHVRINETSRLGTRESDFNLFQLQHLSSKKVFFCELPYVDPESVASRYLIPVGPTSSERECGMLSMFLGVFTAVSMMKSSLRAYTHVMKTRTDYLPWLAPWVTGMLELYEKSGRKIIVDGSLTIPVRYPDRPDIPWQGSISDVFCFASVEQFLMLWDIEDILSKLWTGIPETTLFRAAMFRFLGDDLQSPRRNESFLRKYFIWDHNETKQSFNLLRSGVLSTETKRMILELPGNAEITAASLNKVIRTTYDFIIGKTSGSELEGVVEALFPREQAKSYLDTCRVSIATACPV